MPTEKIHYKDGDCELEGYVAHLDEQKRPLVILCHAWRGRDEFICEKARDMSERGYVGFALDMYGKGILGHSKEENARLKKPFLEDRHLLVRRVKKALEVACALPYIDVNRVGVIGYGFGGLCALDLARSGANLRGAISVYGHFDPLPSSLCKRIQAKILLLHGREDPIVPLKELEAFGQELDQANVEWRAEVYEGAMHAFATPGANDPQNGILFHSDAVLRAERAISLFLSEIFSGN